MRIDMIFPSSLPAIHLRATRPGPQAVQPHEKLRPASFPAGPECNRSAWRQKGRYGALDAEDAGDDVVTAGALTDPSAFTAGALELASVGASAAGVAGSGVIAGVA